MNLRDYIFSKQHHIFRKEHDCLKGLAESFAAQNLAARERMVRRFELVTSLEEPVLLPQEQICFLRTVKNIPDCFTAREWEARKQAYYIHELGYLSNLCPNYGRVIASGLLACRETADPWGKRVIDALLSLADRYREKALAAGDTALAAVLTQVPRYSARNFREALQFFRILHYGLWLEGNYHVTIGRFDQYMFPYLQQELEAGTLTRESALALLEDFFLSFNKDSDLYPGVQQGDNGQSMVLGGIDREGNQAFNILSQLCLEASGHLMMIDPKINLRVNKDTPDYIYELGSHLTKAGLGFPQYSNDDVVIPGLIRLGYAPEDAGNYVVAACWEPIIPGVGRDVANISAISFPGIIDQCLHENLESAPDMEHFMAAVRNAVSQRFEEIHNSISTLWFAPSALMEVMMDGCKYQNFGIHGTGIATAADSLAAIDLYVFREKSVTCRQLLDAVDTDFAENSQLLHKLRYEAPKLGAGSDLADRYACQLLAIFAAALDKQKNCLGGCYRAGTGTAMFYLWHTADLGASPDGRRKGEPLGTNYSPSLFARIPGPLSVIRSFTKPELEKTVNGGPLTLEFAASMFQTEDSIQKVARLVKTFIHMGGHQLQLNAVNTQLLEDAKKNPHLHRQLVVRIWGWSAYFTELDPEYQDHVLRRQQYTL